MPPGFGAVAGDSLHKVKKKKKKKKKIEVKERERSGDKRDFKTNTKPPRYYYNQDTDRD